MRLDQYSGEPGDRAGGRILKKTSAAIGSAVFFVLAQGAFAGLIPWWLSRWMLQPSFDALGLTRVVGGVLIAAGLVGLIDSFARFALQGLGTPAPIAPPEHLVVSGPYRHVRNPMYVCVVAVVLGQAMLFGDIGLLAYCAVVWLGFTLFVLIYEEPTLRSTFGTSYALYCKNVPRWLPRLTPWKQ